MITLKMPAEPARGRQRLSGIFPWTSAWIWKQSWARWQVYPILLCSFFCSLWVSLLHHANVCKHLWKSFRRGPRADRPGSRPRPASENVNKIVNMHEFLGNMIHVWHSECLNWGQEQHISYGNIDFYSRDSKISRVWERRFSNKLDYKISKENWINF